MKNVLKTTPLLLSEFGWTLIEVELTYEKFPYILHTFNIILDVCEFYGVD